MTFAARFILILTLIVGVAAAVSAQETTTAKSTTAPATQTTTAATTEGETPAVPEARNALAVREDLNRVLGRHPREVGRVLGIDPTLVLNDPFLNRYPELSQFIAQHPEIRRNPHYYMRDYEPVMDRQPPEPFAQTVENISIASVFFLIAFALAWLVRTIIEQKRWNHLSRRQSEVHNKILDRFSSSEELLTYIKTPAGTKFLESAPIPVQTEATTTQASPFARVLWSIHLGIIIAIGSLGMLLARFVFDRETASGLFAMGTIGFCIGLGFIVSGVVSIVLSRRLASWQAPAGPIDDQGVVR